MNAKGGTYHLSDLDGCYMAGAVFEDDDAVDDDPRDAERILLGVLERGLIDHRFRVEDGDVGDHAFLQAAPDLHRCCR